MTCAMQPPSDAKLLDICEQGRDRGPVAHTKLLLGAALPELDAVALSALPVSVADMALLRLRRSIFGGHLQSGTTCHACGELLDFELDVSALIDGIAASLTDISAGHGRVREPTIADLEIIAGSVDVDHAIHRLADLCWLGCEPPPPDTVIAQIDARYGQSAIRVHLNCAACGNEWQEDFDIAAYLWQEVVRRGEVLLDHIHIVAATYGWTEQQILALSDARRAAYVQRCGA